MNRAIRIIVDDGKPGQAINLAQGDSLLVENIDCLTFTQRTMQERHAYELERVRNRNTELLNCIYNLESRMLKTRIKRLLTRIAGSL